MARAARGAVPTDLGLTILSCNKGSQALLKMKPANLHKLVAGSGGVLALLLLRRPAGEKLVMRSLAHA